MGETKVTLFELHLDGDTQLGPRTLSSVVGTDDESDVEAADARSSTAEESESDGGRSVLALLVGLVALAGLAVAVKKVRGTDEEPTTEDREVVVG
ncbi:hypothetical protein [Halovivax limisalsi]|uniref:hypothetical protein n=1 Tax=Halovivax limisalsi TaxID=1453760 RepID=UPI001FFCE640|nr:hypothetical protein [Halovivax limisalsi]